MDLSSKALKIWLTVLLAIFQRTFGRARGAFPVRTAFTGVSPSADWLLLAWRGGLAASAAAINEVISEVGNALPGKPVRASRSQAKPKAKTREGKKGLVIYVDPELTRALRKLAANHDTDQQTLALRGLELLFEEFGMTLPRSPATPADAG